MPTFRIERREKVISTYLVEADTRTEAVKRLRKVQPENQLDLMSERSGIKLVDMSMMEANENLSIEYFG